MIRRDRHEAGRLQCREPGYGSPLLATTRTAIMLCPVYGPAVEDFLQGSNARETGIGGLELIGGLSWLALYPSGIQPV